MVWQSLSSPGVLTGRILPSPVAVVLAGVHLTETGELPLHLFESFRRAATGLLIGGSIGFLLGLLNGLSVLADRVLDSSVQMVRNIPHLAMTNPELTQTSPQYLSPFGEVAVAGTNPHDPSRLRASSQEAR
jgi:ABC-type nitrate/sulfonate/bicarbonate transport system permease component